MLAIRAYAKINLYLDVISRYPDGYHQIESVMQSISLYDLVKVSLAPDISVTCTEEKLCGQNNLAFRAADLLRRKAGVRDGATITISKRIPVAAGLAGGSADTAATLAGLNILWGLNLSLEQLQDIGLELGADVPFCLAGGTMLARGKGEVLSSLTPMPESAIVLITPPLQVSTAEVYHALDLENPTPINQKEAFLEVLSAGQIERLASSLNNILENVTLKRYSEVLGAKQRALASGAIGALMSGSGPSVFAICRDEYSAESIAHAMQVHNPSFFVKIIKPVHSGVEIAQGE